MPLDLWCTIAQVGAPDLLAYLFLRAGRESDPILPPRPSDPSIRLSGSICNRSSRRRWEGSSVILSLPEFPSTRLSVTLKEFTK